MLPLPPVATEDASVRLGIKRALGLFLILAAAAPAWGAIAIDQTKSTNRSASSKSITSPSFSTTAANELLLAFISTDGKSAGITVTGVSTTGLTWALVRRTNAQLGTAEVWRAFATAKLTGVTVRATLSQSVAASITVVTFTGTDTTGTSGSGAIGATNSASAPSGPPSASLVTTRAGSWTFAVGNDWDSATGRTLGGGQVLVNQYLASVGDTYWVQRQAAATAASGTPLTINDTAPVGDRYNLTIVEVLPAVSGPTYAVTGTAGPTNLVAGASVALSQNNTTIVTTTIDGSGNYNFPSVANGTYTVTPGKAGINFNPPSGSVTVSGGPAIGPSFTATAQTWTVIGAITGATGVASGASVILSQGGTTIATTNADGSGSYSFSNVATGTYTVTPAKTGVNFNPTSRSVNVSSNTTVPSFSATTQTWTVSGTISPANSGTGTQVFLDGTASSDGSPVHLSATATSGGYTIPGVPNGSYTVTPTKNGYTFNPTSLPVAINNGNGTANFSIVVQAGVISGTITPASNGAGVTVILSGAGSGSTTSDSSGNYSFSGLTDGTYTVTPNKANVTFNPTSQDVTLSGTGVAGVNFSATTFTPNLTVDASVARHTIDGMGVNINVNSLNGTQQLTPALDLLIDTNGASVFRVIRDPMTWVTSESQIPLLHSLDATTLQEVYEAPAMQDIWNTIGYLNQKGISGSQIMLNFMGWTPTWIGGSGRYNSPSVITSGKEAEFATMIASLVYYGRKVKNLNFTLLSPLNESDLGGIEGPSVSSTQYRTIMHDLVNELDFMGLTDVRLVGPDVLGNNSAYITAVMGDSTIAGRLDHIAFHSYGGSTSPGTSYAQHDYWLTETAGNCVNCDNGTPPSNEWTFARQTGDYLLADVGNGFAAVLVYDGYDSFYYHHNSYARWGLIAYDQSTGIYTPRKAFYVDSQLNAFIRPGAVQVSETDSISGLNALAFYNAASGKISIVGHNTSGSAVTINGQLKNSPVSITSFAYYQTNTSTNFQRGADVPVSAGGNFAVSVPADTFFSLSN